MPYSLRILLLIVVLLCICVGGWLLLNARDDIADAPAAIKKIDEDGRFHVETRFAPNGTNGAGYLRGIGKLSPTEWVKVKAFIDAEVTRDPVAASVTAEGVVDIEYYNRTTRRRQSLADDIREVLKSRSREE